MSLYRLETGREKTMNSSLACAPMMDDRYSRCQQDDLKEALDALYAFKKKLDGLHPSCTELIHNLLQVNKF